MKIPYFTLWGPFFTLEGKISKYSIFLKLNSNTLETITGPNMASVNSNVTDIYVDLSQQMIFIAKCVGKSVINMPSLWIDANSNYMEKIDKV